MSIKLSVSPDVMDFIITQSMMQVASDKIAQKLDRSPGWVRTVRSHTKYKMRRDDMVSYLRKGLLLDQVPYREGFVIDGKIKLN